MKSAKVILDVQDGGPNQQHYVFREPRACLVGPALDCDIRISQAGAYDVSFYHCMFVIDPPRIRVRDLVSRNGTFVNGERIGQSLDDIDLGDMHGTELKDGDEVRIGQTVIHVAIREQEDSAEAALACDHRAS